MRVLLVEDDLVTSRALMILLKRSAIVADAVDSGEEALEMARLYDYDLVILDLGLPGIDGFQFTRGLRGAGTLTPVLVLSGDNTPKTRTRCLELGADDFVAKPFNPEELIARIQAVVRRNKGFAHPKLSVGKLALDLARQNVTVDGDPVQLTGKEYAVLELLTLRKNTVVSKDTFLNHLYGGMDEPEGKIIDVFICKLRRKLAQAGAANVIATVWARGYILKDPASWSNGSGAAAAMPMAA